MGARWTNWKIKFINRKNKKTMKPKKLPNEKYLRIFDEQFIEWITEIMSQEKMKYANAQDVAHEIEAQFGGVASSHFLRIRRMRLNVRDFLPTIKK